MNFAMATLGLKEMEKFKITLEQIFLTVGQNNYGNKIPYFFFAFFQLTLLWLP